MTDLNQLINDAAARYGENPDTARRIAEIETGGRNVANEGGSGAAGVFQFMPGTWAQYGGGASPYDIPANVDAGVRLLRDNRAALKAQLGRDPTESELYMAHQQGAAGAAGLITNPDVAAASIVGIKKVLANGGTVGMTAGQFAQKWEGRFGGSSGQLGADYTPPTVHAADLMTPPPVDPFSPDADSQRMAYRSGPAGAMDALGDEFSVNTGLGLALGRTGMSRYAPDPNFNPSPEQIKQYATDPATGEVVPDAVSRLDSATSDAQAKWIAQRAFEDAAKRKRLATLSGKDSFVIGTLATLLDPTTYAVGAATGGILAPAESVVARLGSRASMIGFRAGEGAAANMAYTAALQQLGAPQTPQSYLSAGALGMVLGGAYGALGRRAVMSEEAAGLHAAGESLGGYAAALDGDIIPPRGPRPSSGPRIERGQVIDGEVVDGATPAAAPHAPSAAPRLGRSQPLDADVFDHVGDPEPPSKDHPLDPGLSFTHPAEHPEVLTAANAPYTVGPAAPLGLAEAGARFGLEGAPFGERSISAQMHAPEIEHLLGSDVAGTHVVDAGPLLEERYRALLNRGEYAAGSPEAFAQQIMNLPGVHSRAAAIDILRGRATSATIPEFIQKANGAVSHIEGLRLAEAPWRPFGGPLSPEGARGSVVHPDGVVAYHGSPHDFDRFDLSKIGTGEGAQAFGHGLYFAQRKKLAEFYRDTLSQNSGQMTKPEVRFDGTQFNPMGLGYQRDATHWAAAALQNQKGDLKQAAAQIGREFKTLISKQASKYRAKIMDPQKAAEEVAMFEKSRDDAKALLKSGRLEYVPEQQQTVSPLADKSHPLYRPRAALKNEIIEKMMALGHDQDMAEDSAEFAWQHHMEGKRLGDLTAHDVAGDDAGPADHDMLRIGSEVYDHLELPQPRPPATPALFQVKLSYPEEHMLDWDAPLSEQPPRVRAALEKLGITEASGPGKGIYRELGGTRGGWMGPNPFSSTSADPVRAANVLYDAGVPGIRYWDGNSRSAASGTRNFVAFRDHDIHVTHKNGVELPAAQPLPEFLRGQAKASFGEEMRRAGVDPSSFSTTVLQRAEQILDKGRTLDHGKAVEEAQVHEAPKEVRDAVFERTTQSRVQDANGYGSEGAGPVPTSEPAGAVQRLRGALENSGSEGEGVREGVQRQTDRLVKDRSPAAQAAAQRLYEDLARLRDEAEAERLKVADADGPSPKAAGAAAGADATEHPNVPLYTPAGDFEGLREAGQFTSNMLTKSAIKSDGLFTASGTQLASSPFAATRIIGAHMAGNPIGYRNAKNPLDVAMQALLLRDHMNGRLDRFLKPAFNEWAHDQGYSQVARLVKKPEFMRQVFDHINTKDETMGAHPAIRRYANEAVRPVMREWTNKINDAGLADHIPYDTTYLPRVFDPGKVGDAYRAHGAVNLGKLVKASMADMPWTQALTDAQLSKVANGYAEGISRRALDLDDRWNASWSADNLQHLEGVLMSDAGMSQAEAREITDTVARLTEKDRGANARLKNRVEMNTEATHAATGDLKMSDLLVKDVGYLMERYNDQMAGRVAMARTKITDPETGTVLQNGIKDDAQFETMISDWKKHLEDQYLSRAAPEELKNLERWRQRDEANMRFQYGRILSRAHDSTSWLGRNEGGKTTAGRAIAALRKFSFTRMMGATGWSHLSIFGATLANINIRAMLEHVPAFRHVMSQDGEWIMRHGLDRELEAIFGNHADPLRGLQLQDWSHEWGATPAVQRDTLGVADHYLGKMSDATALFSGLSHIIALSTRWTQKGIAQKFADMAAAAKPRPDGTFDLTGVNMRRMMQLGLDEGDMQKVLGQVQQHFTTEPGILFSHKVTKLNLDQWDQETSHIFQGALRRAVDRIVQHNDVGSLHRWVSYPLVQMLAQFRNFPIVAWTKQLQYNIAMRDPEMASYFAIASAVGALVTYARFQVTSIGRSDRDEYLRRNLTPGNIAHGAIYHAGYAGLMPTMIDTGLRLAGGDPLFDMRTTGNSSDLSGAPAITNITDAMAAAKALRRPWEEHRDRSQAEARALVRMFPWSNTLPATLLTNYAVRNMPPWTPKPPHGPHGLDALLGTGQ